QKRAQHHAIGTKSGSGKRRKAVTGATNVHPPSGRVLPPGGEAKLRAMADWEQGERGAGEQGGPLPPEAEGGAAKQAAGHKQREEHRHGGIRSAAPLASKG